MAVVIFKATLPSLDPDDMDRVVKAFQKSEMRKAVYQFLKACLARIPRRTGFLAGAFSEVNRRFGGGAGPALSPIFQALKEHLSKQSKRENFSPEARARVLGKQKVAALTRIIKKENLKRKAKGLPRLNHGVEYYRDGVTRVLKTPESGIPFTTPSSEVLVANGDTLSFVLNVNISYLAVNDFGSHGQGTPWGAFDAGTAAMLSFLETSVNRFPDINELLGELTISVDRSGGITQRNTKPNIEDVIATRTIRITPGL